MITFEKITSKTIRAPYTIEVNGYKVAGSATYNKENRLTSAHGTVRTADDMHVCSFNIDRGGDGEFMKVSLVDCSADRMDDAAEVAKEVLSALSSTYPQE